MIKVTKLIRSIKVNIPKGFLVWGTGILKNPISVLNASAYERYAKAIKSDKVVKIVKNDSESVTTRDTI